MFRLLALIVFFTCYCLAIPSLPRPIPQPPFENPPQLQSSGGVLQVSFVAELVNLTVNETEMTLMNWNGTLFPPTFWLNRGDILELTIYDQLAYQTNIHFHGMQISPLPGADDVLIEIKPGSYSKYRFSIPLSHPQGVFWYHSHQMMIGEQQVNGGMSGLLVIDGQFDAVPQFAEVTQQYLALKDIQDFQAAENGSMRGVVFTSGMFAPEINIQPNEVQIWHIAAIGPNSFYNLSFVPASDIPDYDYVSNETADVSGVIPMLQIGRDGRTFNSIVPYNTYLLTPAGRFSFVIVGPPAGRYDLISSNVITGPDGDDYPAVVIATLVSSQPDSAAPLVAPLLPSVLPIAAVDLRNATITRYRTFVFNDGPNGTFLINNQTFDPSRIDVSATVGDIEQWTILNPSGEWHVFHVHQLAYQVIDINGELQSFLGYQETVNLPDFQNSTELPGEVRIIMPFTNPLLVGRFPFHCHIMQHEESGMMALIQINARPGDYSAGAHNAATFLLVAAVVFAGYVLSM